MNSHTHEHHSHSLAISHVRNAINQYAQLPLSKRDILMKWKRKIKNLEFTQQMPYEFLFGMTIGLPTGVFSYQFDISSILSFITNEDIQPIELDVDLILSSFDQDYWSEHPDDTLYPPVMLETPLLPKGYLLFGHKRILEAKTQGKKKIRVYSLGEMDFVPLMHDAVSKNLYGFHRDLQNLLSTPHSLPFNSLFISHIDEILKS